MDQFAQDYVKRLSLKAQNIEQNQLKESKIIAEEYVKRLSINTLTGETLKYKLKKEQRQSECLAQNYVGKLNLCILQGLYEQQQQQNGNQQNSSEQADVSSHDDYTEIDFVNDYQGLKRVKDSQAVAQDYVQRLSVSVLRNDNQNQRNSQQIASEYLKRLSLQTLNNPQFLQVTQKQKKLQESQEIASSYVKRLSIGILGNLQF